MKSVISDHAMDVLLANQGFDLLINHISSFLDAKSLAQCRLVSKPWKALIDKHRLWLIFQLDHMQNHEKSFINHGKYKKTLEKANISTKFPEWNQVTDKFKKANISSLKFFAINMSHEVDYKIYNWELVLRRRLYLDYFLQEE